MTEIMRCDNCPGFQIQRGWLYRLLNRAYFKDMACQGPEKLIVGGSIETDYQTPSSETSLETITMCGLEVTPQLRNASKALSSIIDQASVESEAVVFKLLPNNED